MTCNKNINQLDLIEIYRTIHLTIAEFPCLSNAHRTINKIDHILGHKTNLNKLKSIEIKKSLFSGRNVIELAINCKKDVNKILKYFKIKLRARGVFKRNRNIFELKENENIIYQNL